MKKISVAHQLVILFFSIILFFFFIIGIIFLSKLETIYENASYLRLMSYIDGSRELWIRDERVVFEDEEFKIGYIQGSIKGPKAVILYISDDFEELLDTTDVLFIQAQLMHNIKGQGSIDKERSNVIYYAYEVQSDGRFLAVFTNGEYVRHLRNTVTMMTILIFLICITFSVVVISFWSKWFVNRIHNIQNHVTNLPKNNYALAYDDGGEDEISSLARSIEKMRLEILKSESIKREMLQNLSHDFKTPIAVIKSYTEAILEDMAPIESLDIILRQTMLLSNKVCRLLEYNRLEYLATNKSLDNIKIKDVIEDVVNSYLYQTNVEILLDLEDTIYKGYYENYYTVIDNILDNAKRYAIKVIKITLKDEVLTIYNDGEHISEQFLNGLFKAYEKGHKGQFGLGMSIVKKTLDTFNMNLEVFNEEIGVTFKISKKVKSNKD